MNKINCFLISICLYSNVHAQQLPELENADPDSSLGDDYLRYNRDNKVYKANREFVFDYVILEGKDTLKCQQSTNDYGIPNWTLVKMKQRDSGTIEKIGMYVLDGTLDYQTAMGFAYYNATQELPNSHQTGLVENDKNVWLHPVRSDYFAIQEFASFPFIKTPFVIGKKWKSAIRAGYFDSYQRFDLKWEGILQLVEDLEITDKTTLQTPLGKLDCWVVSTICKSKLTESRSTFYFNETYGFVKIDHSLFDKRRLIFDLVEIKDIITVKD